MTSTELLALQIGDQVTMKPIFSMGGFLKTPTVFTLTALDCMPVTKGVRRFTMTWLGVNVGTAIAEVNAQGKVEWQ